MRALPPTRELRERVDTAQTLTRFHYGEGVALQVRSAVSHLNEVWAVDTVGAILHGLAPELGWEWIRDAGRWTYDEARHMLMGKRRLEAWTGPTRRSMPSTGAAGSRTS